MAEREKYDRLLRYTKITSHHQVGRVLLTASRDILTVNPIGSYTPAEEVASLLQTLLPPRSSIFTDNVFMMPPFPIQVLKETVNLYGVALMSQLVLGYFSDDERQDHNGMLFVWLASLFDPSKDFVEETYQTYKNLTATVRSFEEKETQSTNFLPPHSPSSRNVYQTQPVVSDRRPLVLPTSPSVHPMPVFQPEHGVSEQLPRSNVHSSLPTHRNIDDNGHAQNPLPDKLSSPYAATRESLAFDPSKKASAVQSYFREKRFDGDIIQSIHRVVRDYEICAKQIRLTSQQKTDFFINIFEGAARDFFFENCRDDMSFSQLAEVMVREYDSDARRLAIQSELEILTMEKFMRDREITDDATGLAKIVEHINVLTPQGPPNFRSENNKIRYLRHAVLTKPWAERAIGNITTAKYSFNSFVTALREQLQLEVEKGLRASDPSSTTFYQRYGRHPRRDVGYNDRQVKKNPIGRDGRRMLCKICGSEEHFAKICKMKSLKEYARKQLETGTPAVHVLHDIATRMDSIDGCEDPGTENEAAQIECPGSGQVDIETNNLNEATSEVEMFDAIDEAISTHYISTSMGNPYKTFHGRLGPDFQAGKQM